MVFNRFERFTVLSSLRLCRRLCDSDSKTIALRPAFRRIRLKRGNGLKLHKDEDLAAIKILMSEVQYLKFLNGGNPNQILPANTLIKVVEKGN
jgi:hypothetical protein